MPPRADPLRRAEARSLGQQAKELKELGVTLHPPPNAFFLFKAEHRHSGRTSEELGAQWKALPQHAPGGGPCKKHYLDLAEQKMEEEYYSRVRELAAQHAGALRALRWNRRPMNAQVLFRRRLQCYKEHRALKDVWPSNPVALTGPANRLFEDLPLDAKAAFQEAAAEEVREMRAFKARLKDVEAAVGEGGPLAVYTAVAADAECRGCVERLEKVHSKLPGLPEDWLEQAGEELQRVGEAWAAGDEERRRKRVESRAQMAAKRKATAEAKVEKDAAMVAAALAKGLVQQSRGRRRQSGGRGRRRRASWGSGSASEEEEAVGEGWLSDAGGRADGGEDAGFQWRCGDGGSGSPEGGLQSASRPRRQAAVKHEWLSHWEQQEEQLEGLLAAAEEVQQPQQAEQLTAEEEVGAQPARRFSGAGYPLEARIAAKSLVQMGSPARQRGRGQQRRGAAGRGRGRGRGHGRGRAAEEDTIVAADGPAAAAVGAGGMGLPGEEQPSSMAAAVAALPAAAAAAAAAMAAAEETTAVQGFPVLRIVSVPAGAEAEEAAEPALELPADGELGVPALGAPVANESGEVPVVPLWQAASRKRLRQQAGAADSQDGPPQQRQRRERDSSPAPASGESAPVPGLPEPQPPAAAAEPLAPELPAAAEPQPASPRVQPAAGAEGATGTAGAASLAWGREGSPQLLLGGSPPPPNLRPEDLAQAAMRGIASLVRDLAGSDSEGGSGARRRRQRLQLGARPAARRSALAPPELQQAHEQEQQQQQQQQELPMREPAPASTAAAAPAPTAAGASAAVAVEMGDAAAQAQAPAAPRQLAQSLLCMLGWCALQPGSEPACLAAALGVSEDEASCCASFDEVDEFAAFASLSPPIAACSVVVLNGSMLPGGSNGSSSSSSGGSPLLEGVCFTAAAEPSGFAMRSPFEPAPPALREASTAVVVWAGPGRFMACQRASTQPAAEPAPAAAGPAGGSSGPLLRCLLNSADKKNVGWELLRQLLGLACVKAAKSPAGSLAQELAAGLLLPPGLPLHEEVLPPRWHQRGPEHRQVALQEAVRRLVAAGGDGSGCWAPGEERRLAQALEGGLAGLGEGCLDVAKLAACPGLSALAVALQRSIAILQAVDEQARVTLVLFSRYGPSACATSRAGAGTSSITSVSPPGTCGSVLHLTESRLAGAAQELLHPRTVVLVMKAPGRFRLGMRRRRQALAPPGGGKKKGRGEDLGAATSVVQGGELTAWEPDEQAEPALVPPKGALPVSLPWPDETLAQPLSAAELLAAVGCCWPAAEGAAGGEGGGASGSGSSSDGDSDVGWGSCLAAIDSALEMEHHLLWPSLALDAAARCGYRERAAAARQHLLRTQPVGFPLPGPADEELEVRLQAAATDFTQLSESKDLLRLARTLGRHIAVLEWDPQQAQHGGCGAWDLALFPPGRGGAPWAFCLQRREDVMPELFAALCAPATLRLLWREPGRFAAAQLVQPRVPAGGSSTGKGPAAAALPAALPRLPPLPPVAVPTTAASPAEAGAGAEQPLNWLLFAARHCTPAGPCQSSPSSLALEGQLLQRLLPAAAKALQELERYVIAPLGRPPLDFLELELLWPLRSAAMCLQRDIIVLEPLGQDPWPPLPAATLPGRGPAAGSSPAGGSGGSSPEQGPAAAAVASGSGAEPGQQQQRSMRLRRALRFSEAPPCTEGDLLAAELIELPWDPPTVASGGEAAGAAGAAGPSSGSSGVQGLLGRLQEGGLHTPIVGVWAGGHLLAPLPGLAGDAVACKQPAEGQGEASGEAEGAEPSSGGPSLALQQQPEPGDEADCQSEGCPQADSYVPRPRKKKRGSKRHWLPPPEAEVPSR